MSLCEKMSCQHQDTLFTELFIYKVIIGKNNPIGVKYFTYKEEFQDRGTCHIHGPLWLGLDIIENLMGDSPNEEHRPKTEYEEKKKIKKVMDGCMNLRIHSRSSEIIKNMMMIRTSSPYPDSLISSQL